MRVTFLLPAYAPVPVGGYKVVYEYANGLQRRGHQVTVVYPRSPIPMASRLARFRGKIVEIRNRLVNSRPVSWFPVDARIQLRFTEDLREENIPEAEALIATSWLTARSVACAPESRGKKFYLVQHHEIWDGPEEEVNATWVLPLHKIVVSRWLLELAGELGEGERTTFVPCGMDFAHLQLTTPISHRSARIGMLFHPAKWKGSLDGIEALEEVRRRVPALRAVLFGTEMRPDNLPEWMDYVCQPSPDQLAGIYNSCAVFLQPSWTEGWGLPATEAMACGCALVTTDNGGSATYAIHRETAVVVAPRDPQALAAGILRMLNDSAWRERIARNGHEYVQQFTWPRALDAMERLLSGESTSGSVGRNVSSTCSLNSLRP